jgi:hypothetical protein
MLRRVRVAGSGTAVAGVAEKKVPIPSSRVVKTGVGIPYSGEGDVFGLSYCHAWIPPQIAFREDTIRCRKFLHHDRHRGSARTVTY